MAPEVDIPVAGTEAQRLLDVSLGAPRLTEEKLDVANLRVRSSQVSIEVQRPLARPDALKGAIGMHLDHPQQQMGDRILGSEGQRFGQRFFGGGNPRGSIVRKEYRRDREIDGGNADQPHDVSGIVAPPPARTSGAPQQDCQP